jgi:hypothetical protein
MKDITKAVSLAAALVILISMAAAITEQPKAEAGNTTAKPSDLLSPGNEGTALPGTESGSEQQYDLNAPLSGVVPFMSGQATPYTVMAVGFREYIAAGWLDEQTQIILLYHNMEEPEAQMRAGQFFTSLGETAIITTPPQMT